MNKMINGKKYKTLIEVNGDHEVSDVQRIKYLSDTMDITLKSAKRALDDIRTHEFEFFLPLSSNSMVNYTTHGFKCTYCEFEEDQIDARSCGAAVVVTEEQLMEDVFNHECAYENLSEDERKAATTINMLMACASLEMKYYIGRKYNNYIRDFKD